MLRERCAFAWNQLTVEEQTKYGGITQFAKEWCVNECLRMYKEPWTFDQLVSYILNNDKKAYERMVYQRDKL